MNKTSKVFLVVLLLVGLCIRLWIAFQPMEELEYKVTPDDSFYYFQTARHIIAGNGSTFDGIARHNGYHPLWMGLMLPIYAVVPDDISQPGPVSAIRAVLVLGAFLDVAAAFLLFLIILRLTTSIALGILTAVLHLFDPYAVFHSVEGLETPLLGLVLAGTLLVSLGQVLGEPISRRRAVILGVLLGLLMLARTDSVFFAGPLLLVLLVTADEKRQAFRRLFLAGAVASLIVIPWLLFGRLYVGIWGQTSFSATPHVKYIHFLRAHGELWGTKFWYDVSSLIQWVIYDKAVHLSPLGYLLMPLLAFVVVFSAIKRVRGLKIFIAPAVYCFSFLLVHAGWRRMHNAWYYAPLYLFLCLLIPVVIDFVSGKRKLAKKYIALAAGVALTISFAIKGYADWKVGLWPSGAGNIKEAGIVREHLPPGTRIGSTDAGMAGYFGPAGLSNLDGVVSEPARRAVMEGRLLKYCIDNGIRLVGIRPQMQLPEIWGKHYQLYLYPGPVGMEIRDDPWGEPERFAVPDGVIKMGEKRESYLHLLNGWSAPEHYKDPSLIWAVAESAELVVTIPGGTALIEVTDKPFLHVKCKQRMMNIILDDTVIASHDLKQGWQEVYATIPEPKADGRIHIITFRFDPPPIYTPQELGINPDLRTLAAAFSQIRLLPQDRAERGH